MPDRPTGPRTGSPPDTSGDDEPLARQLRDALKPAYLLVRRLGEGGMGAVYLAREPALKRDVAVKIMLPWLAQDPTARARFEREAQAVAAITHPHVINIYGTGELPDGTPYFVMQFISGRSLEARLVADGPLGLRETRRVLGEVAAALAAAHKRGIIHRDIKTANVLQDAESGRVVVTDFGIAAIREPEETAQGRLTQPDTGSPGTPHYMAPEQLLGEPSTEKSDVYAFGLLAYELVTGSGPFRATSPHEVAAAHLRDVPAPLSAARGDVDPVLEQLVAACLSKQPESRPTAEQVVAQIAPGDDVQLEWPPPGLENMAGRLPKLNRRLGLGSALLAAAILGIVLADPDGKPSIPLWLLEVVVVGGAMVLATAIGGTHKMRREARRALRRGYAWLPILEVVADRRGDTGAVITGAREYATLTPDQRNRVRTGRLITAACAFGAAIAPLPALLLVLRLGARGVLEPLGAAVLMLLPSEILLAVAAFLMRAEDRLLRRTGRPRPRTDAPPEIAKKVVAAWHGSFDAARQGQSLGSRPPKPLLTRTVMASLLFVATIALVAMIPLALVNPIGSVLVAVAVPKYSSTITKIRRAEAARAFAPPRDPAITPEAAGRALLAVMMAGDTAPRPGIERRSPALESFLSLGPGLAIPDLGSQQDTLLALGARHALRPDQVRQLVAMAAHPGWAAFSAVARAPRVDVIGTRYTPQALDTLSWITLWIPRLGGMRAAAYARVGEAALRLQQGRPDEAEALIRETLGFGLAVLDNSTTLIETLVGATIVTNALGRLETFYAVTGRTGGSRALRAALDSANARAQQDADIAAARTDALFASNAMAAVRGFQLAALRDSTMPPGFRWEFVWQAALAPCFNARELVFGASPALTEARAMFERQLVRTRADSAYLRAMDAGFSRQRDSGAGAAIAGGIVNGFGWVLGNPRLARCVRLAAPER